MVFHAHANRHLLEKPLSCAPIALKLSKMRFQRTKRTVASQLMYENKGICMCVPDK